MPRGARRAVQYSGIALQQLLLHFAGEALQRALPAWSQAHFDADDKAKRQLTRTVQGYANQDLNVFKATNRPNMYPNTLYSRFERIAFVTGRDPRCSRSLNELIIVSEGRDD